MEINTNQLILEKHFIKILQPYTTLYQLFLIQYY